jgi:hypothetical protein
MRDLAKASDIPTIFVMESMANVAFNHASRVSATNGIQAVWTAMFFNHSEL